MVSLPLGRRRAAAAEEEEEEEEEGPKTQDPRPGTFHSTREDTDTNEPGAPARHRLGKGIFRRAPVLQLLHSKGEGTELEASGVAVLATEAGIDYDRLGLGASTDALAESPFPFPSATMTLNWSSPGGSCSARVTARTLGLLSIDDYVLFLLVPYVRCGV
jgi:hypothetical protein